MPRPPVDQRNVSAYRTVDLERLHSRFDVTIVHEPGYTDDMSQAIDLQNEETSFPFSMTMRCCAKLPSDLWGIITVTSWKPKVYPHKVSWMSMSVGVNVSRTIMMLMWHGMEIAAGTFMI